MKKIIDIFLRSLLTGVAIAIGGTVYLSCPNKYLGAFFFRHWTVRDTVFRL